MSSLPPISRHDLLSAHSMASRSSTAFTLYVCNLHLPRKHGGIFINALIQNGVDALSSTPSIPRRWRTQACGLPRTEPPSRRIRGRPRMTSSASNRSIGAFRATASSRRSTREVVPAPGHFPCGLCRMEHFATSSQKDTFTPGRVNPRTAMRGQAATGSSVGSGSSASVATLTWRLSAPDSVAL